MLGKIYIKGLWPGATLLLCIGLLLGVSSTCQKKKLYIDIQETACKNFKVSNPSYTKVVDPSCTGATNGGRLRISCKYEGKTECIKKIYIKARFYNGSNALINNVSYPSELQANDPLVSISGDSISYYLDYTFASGTDPKSLNFIYVNYYTENDYGDISRKLQLRINSDCGSVDPTTYKIVETVKVNSNTISVNFWDHGSEDGDIVSVWIDSKLVLDNYKLTNAPRTFTFQITGGSNKLIVYAINEGTEGPNTVSISVNGGSQIKMAPDLVTGEAVDVVF